MKDNIIIEIIQSVVERIFIEYNDILYNDFGVDREHLIENTQKIINEEIKKRIQIDEGVDFDYRTKTVSYNPHHEENVDTSLENNPSYDSDLIDGIKVWSIFKRKRGSKGDGNPLVYALKNEGWKFRSKKDRDLIDRQFNLIAEKFALLYKLGITIVIPSGSYLNDYIAKTIAKKCTDVEILEGVLVKLTTEEVNDIVLDNNSLFKKTFNTRNKFKYAYNALCEYFEDMDNMRDGYFSRHFIKDKNIRDVLMNTLKVSKDKYARYSSKINGRDVLVIDDTISRGQTIMEACTVINECYSPNSITVLTLFSKNY